MTDDIDLDALRGRAYQARGQEWELGPDNKIRPTGGPMEIEVHRDLYAQTATFIAAVDPSTVLKLIKALKQREEENERLAAVLHEHELHPDYEYDITHWPRKSGASHEPMGEGWERNVHRGRDGWERFEYREEAYWMRPKPEDGDA